MREGKGLLMVSIRIGDRGINDNEPCFIIAEIGNNHQGDIGTCKEMFKAAKEAGASAVKLQKRDNLGLYTKTIYNKPYDNENSYGETYGEHREFLEFGKEEYLSLKQYAKELDIIFFATAFDITSADFLQEIDLPAFKIASGDIRNIPLIEHIAGFNKPVIISTGAATLDDVKRAYDSFILINKQLCILQCTAMYPATYEELDLNVIKTYKEIFPEAVIGLSSHDNGIAMDLVAYILGARVIEKHFTLNRALKGTDHAFSLEPTGMKKMVRDINRARVALGDGNKKIFPSEVSAGTKMGKSLIAAKYLENGHIIEVKDIAIKSPGGGIPPYELGKLIGKKIIIPMHEEDLFNFDFLEDC